MEMAERIQSRDEVELPMSRQDIADYLGFTIETVSRTLTRLESASVIALPSSKRIVLRTRAVLKRLVACASSIYLGPQLSAFLKRLTKINDRPGCA
jgi:CRP/FNR family transcriptional regulator, nitrogen fixation regulation protein